MNNSTNYCNKQNQSGKENERYYGNEDNVMYNNIMCEKEFDDWSSFPMVLKPAEVVQLTRLSRDVVYALLKISPEDGGIPRIVVGRGEKKRYLVYKAALRKWLMNANDDCLEVAI